jgi:glycosyltransferase involved in cell wall biosynthesis
MISIIIPMYNRATLVGETLDSILAQTYTDWECIVVDDRSTDNSVEVVQKYVDKDSRFKLLIRPEARIKGAPTCRNIGYENSKGDIVYWFDSDDLLEPIFLETIMLELQKFPNAEYACFQRSDFVTFPNNIIRRTRAYYPNNGTIFEQILTNKIVANTPCFCFRRSLLEKIPMLWRDALTCSQDPDFICRTICHSDNGIWIGLNDLVLVRRDGNDRIGMVRNEKSLLTRIQVFQWIYEYVKKNGKMNSLLHTKYLKSLLRLQCVYIVDYKYSSTSKKFLQLIRKLSQNTCSDFTIISVATLVVLCAPVIRFISSL